MTNPEHEPTNSIKIQLTFVHRVLKQTDFATKHFFVLKTKQTKQKNCAPF